MSFFKEKTLIETMKENAENLINTVSTNVNHAFDALGIFAGIKTLSLNEAIENGNSLAVSVLIYEGHYQITEKTLSSAIETKNPDIVKSIIELKEIQVSKEHVISSLKQLDDYNMDDSEREKRKEITRNLIYAMRTKGQHLKEEKIEHTVFMEAINQGNWPAIRLLISLNLHISQDHIAFAEKKKQSLGEPILNELRAAKKNQENKQKYKVLWTLGSEYRNRQIPGYFNSASTLHDDAALMIASHSGKESVTSEEAKKYYYNKPKM